ncbi:MAG: cytochrome c biogenesis heme-transporting ATPase CcmA [Steroidobacteraceae bacterium]
MPQPHVQRRSDVLLEVRDVHLWRGEHHLLRGVSFPLSPGQLLQLNGPNGVGKTSLLRVVAQLLPAESGELLWKGQHCSGAASGYLHELLYLGHSNALKLDLTAMENLRFSVGLQHPVTAAQCLEALQDLAIAQCADLPARVLSAGQRRRVALARLLLSPVPLWVLDEPITNLDVAGIATVEAIMARHLDQGGMILAAAHQSLLVTHAGTHSLQLH